ncbi:MAG: hypothetical protein ABIX01_07160 [Chitinophagaceae bacterium]
MKPIFKLFGILAATMLSTGLLITSCKKEVSNNTEDSVAVETQLASEDDAEADVIFDGVFDNVLGVDEEVGLGAGIGVFGAANNGDDGGLDQRGGANGVDSVRCFTVTRVPNIPGVFPKTITIDFGTGCTGPDGKTRRGKVITVYTGRMVEPGSEATTTFDGFYVDSVHVEGAHRIKNNSTATVRIFTRTVVNGKLSKPSGNSIQWNATHTNTQTAGLGTPNFPLDDEFDITGFAEGQNTRGTRVNTWSRLIINPLHKKFICRWFGSGTVKVTRNGNSAFLDFGTGSCDNQATVTIGGVVHVITLH